MVIKNIEIMALEKDLVPGKKYYLDHDKVGIGIFKEISNGGVTFESVVNDGYITDNGNVGFSVEDYDYTEVPD